LLNTAFETSLAKTIVNSCSINNIMYRFSHHIVRSFQGVTEWQSLKQNTEVTNTDICVQLTITSDHHPHARVHPNAAIFEFIISCSHKHFTMMTKMVRVIVLTNTHTHRQTIPYSLCYHW